MIIKKLKLGSQGFPEPLRRISSPPAQIYATGAPLDKLMRRPRVAIIGTRRITPYGRHVTADLAARLAEQGLVIISGLALGADSVAHRAALEAGGLCVAVLPGPLDNILPVANRYLAKRILGSGGALISEYGPGTVPQRQYFIARNRLVSGLADVVLITEAPEKSGTLHTADFALDQGKDILAVPGSITGANSTGANNLIKSGHAGLATSYKDILHLLGLTGHDTPARKAVGRNAQEQALLDLMLDGVSDGQDLLERSGLGTSRFNQALTMLEIGGMVRPLGANHWTLC